MSAAALPCQDERPASPAISPKIIEQRSIAARREAEDDAVIAARAADDKTLDELNDDIARIKLKARGLSPEAVEWWVNVAKVRYCNTIEMFNRFGVKNNANGDRADGLLIPYFNQDGRQVMNPDGSPFERVRIDKFSGKGKYRSEYGTTVHAYLPPLPHGKTWRGIFKDSTEVVAITEGEFKAGQGTLTVGGIPTIGLGGVDCLVTKNGLVPELAGMKFTDRTVLIVFDAPMTDGVKGGIQRTMNYLIARGAKVKVVDIEATPVYEKFIADSPAGIDKMGLDDYLQAGGTWPGLIAVAGEFDGGESSNDLTLLHSIAIIKGTSQPSYVHLDGPDIGLLRRSSAMAEVLAPEMIVASAKGKIGMRPMFDVWLQSKRRIELQGVVVQPQLPPLSITPDNNWNSWRGMATVPLRNDDLAKIFYDFVHDFFEHGVEDPGTVALHRKRYLQWAAEIFQHPGERPYTSWTFISKDEGIGKSALLELNAHIIGTGEGEGAFIADADNLDTEWTSFYNGKIYIVFNEPSNSNSKMRQKAKNLRTNSHLDCNTKYGAHFRIPNILTCGFTTNEPYAFGISEEARRDWVWEPKWRQSDRGWMSQAAEFGRLACGHGKESDDFRAAVLWELLHSVDLSDYNPKAPAGNSKAKTRAAQHSTSLVDLRHNAILQDVEKLMPSFIGTKPRAIAWTTESWEKWVGESYDKRMGDADKKWLRGEMEKAGLHSGSDRYKYRGKQDRIWFIGNCLWSDLAAEDKTAAKEWGDRESGNYFGTGVEINDE